MKQSSDVNAPKKVGLATAVFLICANMIGTGVFTSLGYQVLSISNGFEVALLWVLGGVIAICGSLTYAELSSRLPESGGEYNFLRKIYGRHCGFLAGWISLTAGFAAPIAATAMALSVYLLSALGVAKSSESATLLALTIVTALSLVHRHKVCIIKVFQNGFTLLKIGLILALIVIGFSYVPDSVNDFSVDGFHWDSVLKPSFGVSLIFVMYAFSGWNAATYISEEVKDPQKNLPKALLIGTLVVTALYLLVNFIFFYTTPVSLMKGKPDVAFVFAEHILGVRGGRIIGFIISFGLISAISSMIWAGSSVARVMGRDFKALTAFARLNKHHRPSMALGVQWIFVCTLILTSTYEKVIYYIGFSLSLCSVMTVVGIFILRNREKSLVGEITKPKFKIPLFPLPPIVFLVICIVTMIYLGYSEPKVVLTSVLSLLIGSVVYVLTEYPIRIAHMMSRIHDYAKATLFSIF